MIIGQNSLLSFLVFLFSISVVNGQQLEVNSNIQDSLLLRSRLYSTSEVDQLVEEVISSLQKRELVPSIISVGEATHGTEEIRNIQITCAKEAVKRLDFKSITLAEQPFVDTYEYLKFVLLDEQKTNFTEKRQHYDVSKLQLWLKEYNSKLSFDKRVWLMSADRNTAKEIIIVIDSILIKNGIADILESDSYSKVSIWAMSNTKTYSNDTLRFMIKVSRNASPVTTLQ